MPVPTSLSVLIPFDSSTGAVALQSAEVACQHVAQVVLSGPAVVRASTHVTFVHETRGRGFAVNTATQSLVNAITVIQSPGSVFDARSYELLAEPLVSGVADVVVPAFESSEAGVLARVLKRLRLHALDPGAIAMRTDVLRSVTLRTKGGGFKAELQVKLAAQAFRFFEVEVIQSRLSESSWSRLSRRAAEIATAVRYATVSNDSDDTHEGYNTLSRLDQAPNYNAWLGRKLRAYLGPRVLEVGAGIGTITRELLTGRELIIALEADSFYAQRLANAFRDEPRIRPMHAPVETTDWSALAEERLDSVVLSNVLEHIEDDFQAVRNFRRVLPRGGKLVLFVPALPSLFGSIDKAVGHFRRYTPKTLRAVIERGGFRIDSLEWMNLLGIPGWFLNGRILKRRSVPPFQLRVYDQIAPLLAGAESLFRLPVGMSLLSVATAV